MNSLVTVLVALCLTADRGVLLDAGSPAAIAAAFRAGEGWKATDAGLSGIGLGSWRYAPFDTAHSDYTVEATVKLTKPATQRDGMEMGAYTVYHAHANLGGYEAGICVRYHSPARQYRIAVSSLWKEIVLWRPTGGIVQAVSFPFEIGKTYRIRVTCRGPNIAVKVDDTDVFDWCDTADPILAGSLALACKEGETSFSAVRITREEPAAAKAPAPRISERRWHDGNWFFDGNEPLFVLRDDNVLDQMKLQPGYRAAMYAFNFITDWNRFFPKKIVERKVLEQGQRLVMETKAIDPDKPAGISCVSKLVVSFNPDTRMYEYEHACTVTLPASAESELVGAQWDHGDAVFLGSVGSARTRVASPERPIYEWSVFETPAGKTFKVPHNHNGHYVGKSSTNGGPIRPGGGRLIAVGDAILSPFIEIPKHAPEFTDHSVGLCWWAYDVHTMFTPKRLNNVVAPGTYTSTVRYGGLAAPAARNLLSRAELYEPLAADVKIPVFTAGIGAIEPFDKEVLLASPHTEHRIWAGVIDRSTGHGDRSSLRLDGPTEAWTLTGPSYFVGSYARRNRVSVWVKTETAKGDGPTIGFRRMDNNTAEFHPLGVTGTSDWKKVSYVTSFPGDSFGVIVYFRNSGTGRVWFDNFCIEPLADDAPLDAPVAAPLPRRTEHADVVLSWQPTSQGDCLLDTSGYGHHGKIHGVADTGQRELVLDGKASYVWPLLSPALTLGPDTTVLLDLKPAGEGLLFGSGFQFTVSAAGSGPEQAIEYRAGAGPPVRSRPFIKVGQWQQLGIVFHADRIALFLDGKPVEELRAATPRMNWSLHDQATWHRHLTFFGMGPGNMSLVDDSPAYCWKGSIRSVKVLQKAIDPRQVAER